MPKPTKVNYLGKVDQKILETLNKKVKSKDSPHTSTQRFIAKTTAIGFFVLISLPLVFLMFGRINVNDAVELIKTIAAVLGGIVGLVWGFYFYSEKS